MKENNINWWIFQLLISDEKYEKMIFKNTGIFLKSLVLSKKENPYISNLKKKITSSQLTFITRNLEKNNIIKIKKQGKIKEITFSDYIINEAKKLI